jgi:SAM-dependent methyltransferase
MNQFELVKSNPYYLIKRNVFEAVRDHAHELYGVLLDFGCGTKPYRGQFLHVKEYVGLDYQNPGHDHRNENIDVFYDGTKIPFEENYFDSVLSSEVFEHVFELDATLKEIARVMKSGGKILITCPFVWNLHEEPHDFARYTPHALRYLFEKNGFEILKIEQRGDFRQVMHQLRIIYKMKTHFLLNNSLLKTWIFNNRYFSFQQIVKGWIAFYNNSRAMKKQDIGRDLSGLYLTNVVLAKKR